MRAYLGPASFLIASLLAAGCGSKEDASTHAPGSAQELGDALLAALRAADGERFMALVQPRDGQSYGVSDAQGVEESLRKLTDLELTLAKIVDLTDGDNPRHVIHIDMVGPGDKATGKLICRPGTDGWQATEESAMAFLRWALYAKTGKSTEARQTQVILDNVQMVIEAYARDHEGQPPATLDALSERMPEGGEAYLSAIPGDGWGRRLQYEVQGGQTYALRSRGRDGLFDTEDDLRPKAR